MVAGTQHYMAMSWYYERAVDRMIYALRLGKLFIDIGSRTLL